MRDSSSDKLRLLHILSAISEVEEYLKNVTFEDFLKNSEKRFATIKQIEIIGEACNALTESLKSANSNIPWRAIKGFRNMSIHEYFGVNFRLVWEIAQNDLPEMRAKIQSILENISN